MSDRISTGADLLSPANKCNRVGRMAVAGEN